MGGFYTDNWDKGAFASASTGLEVTSPMGIGFILDFAWYWNYQQYTPDDYQQIIPGAGISYRNNHSLFWLHYQAQINRDALSRTGHSLAFHAIHLFDNGISFGGDAALGIYKGFQTIQINPTLKYRIIPEVTIFASGMMQIRTGGVSGRNSESGDLRNKKLRGSGELGFEFTLPHVLMKLSGYYGRRWYTTENKGLLVWNSDEELAAGTRASLTIFPHKVVSATLEFRHDYGLYQFGQEHNFHILGFVAGLQAAFK